MSTFLYALGHAVARHRGVTSVAKGDRVNDYSSGSRSASGDRRPPETSGSVRRSDAPAPAGHRRVVDHVRAGLGVVQRQPRPPFDVAHEGSPELRVGGQPRVVGRQAHQ